MKQGVKFAAGVLLVLLACAGVLKAWSGYQYQRAAHVNAQMTIQWLMSPATLPNGATAKNPDGSIVTRAQMLELVAGEAFIKAAQQGAK